MPHGASELAHEYIETPPTTISGAIYMKIVLFIFLSAAIYYILTETILGVLMEVVDEVVGKSD